MYESGDVSLLPHMPLKPPGSHMSGKSPTIGDFRPRHSRLMKTQRRLRPDRRG